MTGSAANATGTVEIRDRRELPFFQVRLSAVSAIRKVTAGPRRLRAIGFYALLCQLANEQRHVGDHQTVRVTYDALTRRARLSKSTVRLMLDAVQRAEVVRYERLNDPDRGAVVSMLRLLVQDGAWTAVTVAMADRLASERADGNFLRDLGLVVVLLEFCAAQRGDYGGLRAEVTRGDIAERSGITVDRVDDCNRVLARAGILAITRRRGANGGRHLPSLYTIQEAPSDNQQGGELVPGGRQNGTGRAEEPYSQGGEPVPTGQQNGTGRAEPGYSQSGDSAASSSVSPPSNADTRIGLEEKLETLSPIVGGSRERKRGEGTMSAEELCDALVAAWEPALGDVPRQGYEANRHRWLDAAAIVVGRHTRSRLLSAIEYMVTDDVLGSQTLSMPGFVKVVDQLIARAYARRQRLRVTPSAGATGDRSGWEEAKQHLQLAIQRYGREGREQAMSELAEHSVLLPRFVEQVRWGRLCEQPFQYEERRYAELWQELAARASHEGKEPAA